MIVHARLTVDVSVDGMTEEELTSQLRYAAKFLADAGLLTGESMGEVKTWNNEVTILGAPEPKRRWWTR